MNPTTGTRWIRSTHHILRRCEGVNLSDSDLKAKPSEGARLNLFGGTGSKWILNKERKRVQTRWGVEISASNWCIRAVLQLSVHYILGYWYSGSNFVHIYALLCFSFNFFLVVGFYWCRKYIFKNFRYALVDDAKVLTLPPQKRLEWVTVVSLYNSSRHNSNGPVQRLMKFAVRLRDDWRMIWVTFAHVRGLDLVSGYGLIYKSGCNLKHHEIVAGVKGRWAFLRFYNSKAVSPGPGPRPDSERAVHTASLCRRQFEPFCKAESEFIVPRRLIETCAQRFNAVNMTSERRLKRANILSHLF